MKSDLAKTGQLRQNEAMMKRLFLVFSLVAILTAVCGVHAFVPDPAEAYSFENAKTLVPRSLSGWIICRNDPINLVDPDGKAATSSQYMVRIAASTVMGSIAGMLAASYENNGRPDKHNLLAGFIAGFAGGFVGGVLPPILDTPGNAVVTSTVYFDLQGKEIINPEWHGSVGDGIYSIATGEAEMTDVFSEEYSFNITVGTAVGAVADGIFGLQDELIGNPGGSLMGTYLVIIANALFNSAQDIDNSTQTAPLLTTDEIIEGSTSHAE